MLSSTAVKICFRWDGLYFCFGVGGGGGGGYEELFVLFFLEKHSIYWP